MQHAFTDVTRLLPSLYDLVEKYKCSATIYHLNGKWNVTLNFKWRKKTFISSAPSIIENQIKRYLAA